MSNFAVASEVAVTVTFGKKKTRNTTSRIEFLMKAMTQADNSAAELV